MTRRHVIWKPKIETPKFKFKFELKQKLKIHKQPYHTQKIMPSAFFLHREVQLLTSSLLVSGSQPAEQKNLLKAT